MGNRTIFRCYALFVVDAIFLAQYLVCYSSISKKLKFRKKTLDFFMKMVYNKIKVVESGGKRLKGGREKCFLVNIIM